MAAHNTASKQPAVAAHQVAAALPGGKASTRAQPSTAHSQKPLEGRCRSTSAATTAVASGSTPVTTAACMASTSRSARPMKIGKPSTVPKALTTSAGTRRRAARARGPQQVQQAQQPGHRSAPAGHEKPASTAARWCRPRPGVSSAGHRKDQHTQGAQCKAALRLRHGRPLAPGAGELPTGGGWVRQTGAVMAQSMRTPTQKQYTLNTTVSQSVLPVPATQPASARPPAGTVPASALVSRAAGATLAEQLALHLAERIQQRLLAPGSRLPSVRDCAQRQGVSPSTVVGAYDLLQARGLVQARPQRGFFVREIPAAPAQRPAVEPPGRHRWTPRR
jgi:hypothetical protein